MGSKSDHELIAELNQGHRHALGDLFDRYSADLYDFTYRVIGDRDQAARLLEEIFERLPSATSELSEQVSLRGWLYSLARDLALNFLRQKDGLEELLATDEPGVPGLVGDIWNAARTMPAFHRAVLVIEELHGLSPTEKARALGVMRTDLPRLLEEATKSFNAQFDVLARQHGRPASAQIDPEHTWGLQRRFGTQGSLFGYLPAVSLPESLAEMIRAKVVRDARLSEDTSEEIPGEEPAVEFPPAEELPAEELPPAELPGEPQAPASLFGCSLPFIGLALVIALLVAGIAIAAGYWLTRDTTLPTVVRFEPSENATISPNPLPGSVTTRVPISASFRDNRAIDFKTLRMVVDGRDVTAQAVLTETSITYNADLESGQHVILVEVRDSSGNKASRAWQFTVVGSHWPTATPTNTPTITPTPPPSATLPPTLHATANFTGCAGH